MISAKPKAYGLLILDYVKVYTDVEVLLSICRSGFFVKTGALL
jgi:hypothetical protein